MPYITQERRNELAKVTPSLDKKIPSSAGDLQFVIADLINKFLNSTESREGKLRYQHMNDVMGALSGAQQEFYRLVVVPYEDSKREENGDVYDDFTTLKTSSFREAYNRKGWAFKSRRNHTIAEVVDNMKATEEWMCKDD